MSGGLIELPGMKGTIEIHYDLTRGMVNLEAKNVAHAHVLLVLLAAAQGCVNDWATIDTGIIRPKGTTSDGSEKKDDNENNG